jgi:VanZ family protein
VKKTRWIFSRQASIVLLVVLLLVTIGLSLNPRPEEVLGPLSVYDKAGHFAAYVAVAFFAVRATGPRGPAFLILAIAACALFGGAIELIQPTFGRHKDFFDFLVDLGGSAAGGVISFLVRSRLRGSLPPRG